jgi:hypothetical protein
VTAVIPQIRSFRQLRITSRSLLVSPTRPSPLAGRADRISTQGRRHRIRCPSQASFSDLYRLFSLSPNQPKNRHFDRSRSHRERRSGEIRFFTFEAQGVPTETSEMSQKPHDSPHFIHVFPAKKSRFQNPNARRIRPNSRNQPPNNQELTTTHHNSPQNPKTHFIHSQVVCPHLLT